MDIQMPGMDGYETAAAIRRLEKEAVSEIPIIALSSDAMEEDRQKSLRSGMNEHFAKPVDIDVMQKVINKILEDKNHD